MSNLPEDIEYQAAEGLAMGKTLGTCCGWQIVACLLGLIAGFLPGISWTGPFWGLSYMSGGLLALADDHRVRVTGVDSGSPAEQVGFRTGDFIRTPEDFAGVSAALEKARQGQTQVFHVQRGDRELTIETGNAKPELAAVWYAGVWYPIGGAIFLCIGIVAFATGPIVPAPFWRSTPVTIAGLVIAARFAVELARSSVFGRFRVYQRWPMGTGAEWSFQLQQGWIGIVAGVLLAVCAAADIRRRLAASSLVRADD